MKTFSEMAGLVAGLALFLGTLMVAEAYVARSDVFHTALLDTVAD
jgi:hypothetical protein